MRLLGKGVNDEKANEESTKEDAQENAEREGQPVHSPAKVE